MEWTKYFTVPILRYEEYTTNIFRDSHIFLEKALQAQIMGKEMACEIPSNLSGINNMYNHLGWVVLRGYGKKSKNF
jgi:hypothetical protein